MPTAIQPILSESQLNAQMHNALDQLKKTALNLSESVSEIRNDIIHNGYIFFDPLPCSEQDEHELMDFDMDGFSYCVTFDALPFLSQGLEAIDINILEVAKRPVGEKTGYCLLSSMHCDEHDKVKAYIESKFPDTIDCQFFESLYEGNTDCPVGDDTIY